MQDNQILPASQLPDLTPPELNSETYILKGWKGMQIKDGLTERARLQMKIEMKRYNLTHEEYMQIIQEEQASKNETRQNLELKRQDIIDKIGGSVPSKVLQEELNLVENKIALYDANEQRAKFQQEFDDCVKRDLDTAKLQLLMGRCDELIAELTFKVVSSARFDIGIKYMSESNEEIRQIQKELRKLEYELLNDLFEMFGIAKELLDTTRSEYLEKFLNKVSENNLDPAFLKSTRT